MNYPFLQEMRNKFSGKTVRWQQNKNNTYEGVVVKFLGWGDPIPEEIWNLGDAHVKGQRVSECRCRILVKTTETTKGVPIYRTPVITQGGKFKGEILD